MNKALVKFMADVGITTYVPTENDYLRLAYESRVAPEPGSPEAELEALVLKIYHFDHYYDYSDDNRVWRAGKENEALINVAIDSLEDKVIAGKLRSCFGPNGRDSLAEFFPWLVGYQSTSRFAHLVKGFDLSASEAGNLMAVGAFINKQLDELRKRGAGWSTVYAKDPWLVREHVLDAKANRQTPLADPFPLPNAMYRIWGLIGELLDTRGVYSPLQQVVNLQVLYHGPFTRYQVGNATLFM